MLRERRSRFAGLHRYFGFVAVAAMMAAATLLLAPSQATRSVVSGAPAVAWAAPMTAIDGDTLRAGNGRIRLNGIDAPELSQTCRDEYGRDWPCGRAAKMRLAALVAQGEISCAARGRDRYGRTLAVCASGGIADLGEVLVREGYAVDYFEGGYRAAEGEARAARRGLWGGSFERPQEWRRRHPHTG